ncbi:RagB/SusD family nutrient uptake outer membrane protein [Sunxiuqinia indica]|uniref:RagB/SusD family nutrient uptake outer membrane protein n=1 Tax=Sunxiuqinia indica TaxID=2692584 RepID=UPI001358C1B8|nr:RagB/SusD family nutrient uptake outer membrane protein [Sunxiuqinia indica]
MKKRIFTYFILLIVLLAGCRDYVDIDPVGNNRELIYTEDYRSLMNGYSNMEYGWSYPMVSCDDAAFSETYAGSVSDLVGRVYTWQDFFYVEGNQDSDWNNLYKTIYYANVVSDGVMDSKDGTEMKKKEILAEAKVHRAYSYLCLVNMYAPHYNPATATTDKSVPLLLTSNLFAKLNRASVENVYKQILIDLTEALEYLPDEAQFNVLPSKAAAYALLARADLYMGEYEQALTDAQASLDLNSRLNDLNLYASNPWAYPVLLQNEEVLLSKKATYSFIGTPLSSDVLSLLGPDDLRYSVYTAPGYSFSPSHDSRAYAIQYYSYTNGLNVGPTVPEVMLIKAESQARTGNDEGAIATINSLREKRFTSGSDYEISLAAGESALDYVLTERRIELMGRGFRWFDQKRFNLEEGRRQNYTRAYRGETFTLEPHSEAYVYPIFEDLIQKNPELGE